MIIVLINYCLWFEVLMIWILCYYLIYLNSICCELHFVQLLVRFCWIIALVVVFWYGNYISHILDNFIVFCGTLNKYCVWKISSKVTINLQNVTSLTKEKTALVIPNAIQVWTEAEKVISQKWRLLLEVRLFLKTYLPHQLTCMDRMFSTCDTFSFSVFFHIVCFKRFDLS